MINLNKDDSKRRPLPADTNDSSVDLNTPDGGATASSSPSNKKKSSDKAKEFNPQARTRAVWFKFYPEAFGIDPANVDAFKAVQSVISQNTPDGIYMHSIVHDKCFTIEDYKSDKSDKVHMHLLFFSSRRDNTGRLMNFRMSSVFKILSSSGWLNRPEDLDELHRSAKFPNMRLHAHVNLIVYHTHETEQAISESKHVYDRSECVTNIPPEVLDSYYDEYFVAVDKQLERGAKGKLKDLPALTREQKAALFDRVKDLALSGESFTDFWTTLPSYVQIDMNLRKQLESCHSDYVDQFLHSDKFKEHRRVFVYIYGPANTGKSYNAFSALSELGETYKTENSSTGKYDGLKASHDCMIFDDTSVVNLLEVTDDHPCKLNRRNSNNPLWIGHYVVVTHNLPFDQWLKEVQHIYDPVRYKAAKSRAFIIRVDADQSVHVESAGCRGTVEEQKTRALMFKRFFDLFIAGVEAYKAGKSDNFDVNDFLSSLGISVESSTPVAQSAPSAIPDYDRRQCVRCKWYNSATQEPCRFYGSASCKCRIEP